MLIVVIGEICTDIFIYGETKRLCPEAPVPVFIPIREVRNVGMAGNVVRNINVIDPNIDVELITDRFSNITKTRYVEEKSNHMFIRIDDGEKNITPLRLTIMDLTLIKQADAVIVSDYNKNLLDETTLLQIGENAKMSFLDGKGVITKNIIEKYNIIKINESEYNSNKSVFDCFPDKLIVTLGKRGAMYKSNIYESPSPRDTIDVSGAGDTFLAAFGINYLQGQDPIESIKFANWKSSIVVTKRGVATP